MNKIYYILISCMLLLSVIGCVQTSNKQDANKILNDINFKMSESFYLPPFEFEHYGVSYFIGSEINTTSWEYYNPENIYYYHFSFFAPDYTKTYNFPAACFLKGNPGDNIYLRYCSLKAQRQIVSLDGTLGKWETLNINYIFDIRNLKREYAGGITDKNQFLLPSDINFVSIIYNNKDLLK